MAKLVNACRVGALSMALVTACSHSKAERPALSDSDQIRFEAVAQIAGHAKYICVGVTPDGGQRARASLVPTDLTDPSPALLRAVMPKGGHVVPVSQCPWVPFPDLNAEGTASNPIRVALGSIWVAPAADKAYVDVYTSSHLFPRGPMFRPAQYGQRVYVSRANGVWCIEPVVKWAYEQP